MSDHVRAFEQPPHQFSLGALFKLTLIVALLLTLGVLASPWEPIAIVVFILVGFLDRVRLIKPRWLAHCSIALFGTSLCMPAISLRIMGDPEVFMGWQAFYVSFRLIPEMFVGLWPWNEPDDIEWAIAYLVGAAANVAFLAAYFANLFIAKSPKARNFAHLAAALSIGLVFVDLCLLLFADDLGGIYPGFGFWAASMLALALGTRRL